MKLFAPVAALAVALAGSALALATGSASPVLGSCPVFPASNVWNQPVNALPVEADSAQLIASIGLDNGVHADFGSGLYNGSSIGIPYVVVHGKTTPKSRVKFDYADESDKGPYPIPSNVPIEGYPHSGDGDRHALIVDRDTCRLYELYALRRSGAGWAAGCAWLCGGAARRTCTSPGGEAGAASDSVAVVNTTWARSTPATAFSAASAASRTAA